MSLRLSPILVGTLSLLTISLLPPLAIANGNGKGKGRSYSSCVQGGGSGCRGQHHGEHRRQHGRRPSHVRAAHSGYFHGRGSGWGGGSGRTGGTRTASRRSGNSTGSYATSSTGPSIGEVFGATALAIAAGNRRNQTQPTGTTMPRRPNQPPAQNPTDESEEDDDDQTEEIAQALGQAAFSTFGQVQAAVEKDLADCSGSTSQASRCCGDPSSCRGQLSGRDARSYEAAMALINSGPQKSGLKDYCGQMKSLSDDAKNLNRGLSAVCFEAQDTCESVCEDLAEDYSDVLADCNGCEAQSLYQNALAQLRNGQRTCSSLGQNVDNMADQGIDSALNQAIALHCGNLSSSQNQARVNSAHPGGESPLSKSANSEAAPERDSNSKTAGEASEPGRKMDLSVNAGQGFKGYSNDRGPETQSPFEVTNRNRGGGFATAGATSGLPATGEKAKGKNDKGSASPGTADNQKAKADDDAKNKPSLTAKKDDKTRGPASSDGLSAISGNEGQFENFQSLGSYLSAGVRTAMNRLSRSKEINDKEEDLFGRITAKIREKCRIGILKACEE